MRDAVATGSLRVGIRVATAAHGRFMERSAEDLGDLVQRGYRFAYSLTHDAGRADDLLQDGWLAVLRARGPWTVAYLFTAIRSRFIDECRRDTLIPFVPLDTDALGDIEDPAPTAAGSAPSAAVDRAAVDRLLGALRPEERAVLYLTDVEDFTAQQIADLFGWPRGTVLSLAHRARRKLRDSGLQRPGATA